jgi:hypothetical protein
MLEKNENSSDFILYTSTDGAVRVDVFLKEETVWLTQKAISELFNVQRPAISKHLKNIFDSGELLEELVCSKMEHTTPHGAIAGKTQEVKVKYYNLDAIISIGYRVNSKQATQFRIWATTILKEFIIKGFVLDDKRLKQGGQLFGKDYFDELLERIREIRASERRFYQKITDIYAQCSVDYDAKSELTLNFYKTVQNKLHWAITNHTAAEIIDSRVDATKINMGLTTWRNSPNGKILKSDTFIAKNYLLENEIKELNRLVELYLNFAELQAERNIPLKMIEWTEILDSFLKINRYDLLLNHGEISHEKAILKASNEFEKYRIVQDKDFISDFDTEIKTLNN